MIATTITIGTFLSALVVSLFTLWVWRHRRAQYSICLLLLLLSAVVWCICQGMQAVALSEAHKLLWAKLRLVSVASIGPLWLIFCLELGRSTAWATRRRVALVFAAPATTVLLGFTNEWHHLVWANVRMPVSWPACLTFDYGSWFWPGHVAYAWFVIIAGLGALISELTRMPLFERRRFRVVVIAAAIPLGINFVTLTQLATPPPVDPTPVGVAIAIVLISLTLARRPLIQLKPVAYETVIRALPDSVLVLDVKDRLVALNPTAERELHKPAVEVLGKNVVEAYPRWREVIDRFLHTRRATAELMIEGDERTVDVELSIVSLSDDEGNYAGRVVTVRDITENRAYQRRIEELAFCDALTGLPNRRSLQRDAERALGGALRRHEGVALLFLDLDRFKEVNDALGHAVGDQLLHAVGERLAGGVRTEDLLARIGGDEFAVLMRDCDQAEARTVAERLLDTLDDPLEVQGEALHVGATIGIALYPGDGTTVEQLLSEADVAMYQAKRSRQSIAFYDASRDTFTEERLQLANELRRAIEERALIADYQAISESSSARQVAVEALARWPHPTRGQLLPAAFLPLIEERGMVQAFDRMMLERALAEIAPLPLELTVNVAWQTVLADGFAGYLEGVLERTGVDARRLMLELTERELIHPEQVAQRLYQLRELGVRLAADDFGCGYSSLSYLRQLPLNAIKLDASLISGLGSRREDEALVEALLRAAGGLGIDVVAEGVEREDQRAWLEVRRCPFLQGFLISRPVPLDQLVLQRRAAAKDEEARRALPRQLRL